MRKPRALGLVLALVLVPLAVVAGAFAALGFAFAALVPTFDFGEMNVGSGGDVHPLISGFVYEINVVDDARQRGLPSPRDPVALVRQTRSSPTCASSSPTEHR